MTHSHGIAKGIKEEQLAEAATNALFVSLVLSMQSTT